ncbi:unnamed protein product [Didymodactylos carnosus]|uniref:YihY/virulence factor BrkB family protein n=1 Tax=Didymodactylos carnosus TaxID=1234261 RepID=A0A815DLN2_9BILA|nr:unnamed protein product [Didymodactylos carnosus]CAF1298147.1 unnamed protein product [Didymodactylos carnosus]CAF3934727.1 unnamed protein product [Didymodactylos carnosus]CAF4116597.1 unnamed protein product [Didymodactylos carnosus]
MNDWSLDFASMLAYNLLIALLPIAVTFFGIFGLVMGNDAELQNKLKNEIINAFPADNTTQSGITQIVDLAFKQLSKDAGFALAIGILFSMFGASRLFIAIDKSMTIIYRLKERPLLKQYLLAMGMIFLLTITITLMIVASAVPTGLLSILPGANSRAGTYIAGLVVSLCIAFLLFELIYFIVPNKRMTLKTTWCGSLIAAIVLEIFILLFPLYVKHFMGNFSGVIGFAVILLLFFYYFATILILGAQINAFFFEHIQPLKTEIGSFLNTNVCDEPLLHTNECDTFQFWKRCCRRKRRVHEDHDT